jgi:hypothetical protein
VSSPVSSSLGALHFAATTLTPHTRTAHTPSQAAAEILDNFACPALPTVRNKSAYLATIMKRFRADATAGGIAAHAAAALSPAAAAAAAAAVDAALAALFARGAVAAEQIDQRAIEYLHSLPEHVALAAVAELGAANLTTVRNVAAYFKGICRRHAQMAGLEAPAGGAPGGGAMMGGMGMMHHPHGMMPPQQQQAPYPGAYPGGYPAAPQQPYGQSYGAPPMPYGAPPPPYGAPQHAYAQAPPQPYGAPQQQHAAYAQQAQAHAAAAYAQQQAAAYAAQQQHAAYAAQQAAYAAAYGQPPPGAPPAAAPAADPYAAYYGYPPAAGAAYPGAAAPGAYDPYAAAAAAAAAPIQLAPAVTQRLNEFFAATGAIFDGGAWEMLRQLPEAAALTALEQVHGALVGDKGVRNPSAYFTGIARKHLGLGGAAGAGAYGDGVPADAALASLPPRLRELLESQMACGVLSRDKIDFRVVDTLRRLSEEQAIAALEEMARTDLSRLRNPSAYLMGICNKHLKG